MRCSVLGPLEVLGDDLQLVRLPGAKERLLLAVLAAAHPGAVSVARLCDLLWDGVPPPTAHKSLQAHVVRLRSALQPGRPRGSPGRFIVRRSPGYALNVGRDELDASVFTDKATQGRVLLASRDARNAERTLATALRMWRGEPYADWPEAAFAVSERRRLAEVRCTAMENRFNALLDLGRHAEIVPELERLVVDEPLHEGWWSILVLALYRCGRQGDALEAIRRARAVLANELGIDPGPRLRELEQAVLEQSNSLEPPAQHSLAPSMATQQAEPIVDSFHLLVGRRRERDVLNRAFDDAHNGHGRLILLAGEPGIGKTRLADDLDAHATDEGALVVWGRCWEAGGAPAFWPWIQSLGQLVHDLDADSLRACAGGRASELAQLLPELRDRLPGLKDLGPASPDAARFRLFVAVGEFLRAASQRAPLVVILEDLHAADAPSILLLRFVADELVTGNLLLIGTFRDVELRPEHQLASSLPDLIRARGALRLTLTGLDAPDVGSLVQAVSGVSPSERLVRAIHEETEGNPFFIREIVQLMSAEGRLSEPAEPRTWAVPDTVREVIGRRLNHLGAEEGEALKAAAVLGRDFTADALAVVLHRSTHDVFEALRGGLDTRVVIEVSDAPGRFRFAHVLVRDALYDGLGPADRVLLHRAVGTALESRYAPDRDPHLTELAHHFFEAAPGGDVDKAVKYARRAGERAITQVAYEEAVRLFKMALRALENAPDEAVRCELTLDLGDAQARAGESHAARQTFLEAASLATQLNQPTLLARAALGYGGRFVWLRAGTDRQLVPLLERALAALGSRDAALRSRLLARLSGALRDQPAAGPRDALSHNAVELARQLGDADTLMHALLGRWAAVGLGADGVDEQRVLADELDRVAEQAGDRERIMDACHLRLTYAKTVGDVEGVRRGVARYSRLAAELGQPSQRWYAGVMRTALALQDGRFAEAEDLIAQTHELGLRAQTWEADAASLFATFVLRREQDRLPELLDELRRAPEAYPGYRGFRCMLTVSLCELGRLNEGRRIFQELAADEFGALPRDNEWLSNLSLLADAADTLGLPDHAATLYRQLAPYAGLVALAASEVSMGPVARPLGVLAHLTGRAEAASRHFDESVAMCQRMGARPWLARTQYGHALVLARGDTADQRRRALALIDEALMTCRDTGMEALRRRLVELRAKLGNRN